MNTMSRETILRDYLNGVWDQYDVILLDCLPVLGHADYQRTFAAADKILIPMQAHYLSIKSLGQLIHTISKVKSKINPGLKISGGCL